MILQWRHGNRRFTLACVKFETTEGLNSNLLDGNHCLMWDFDDKLYKWVHAALLWTQNIYQLPQIYIFQSSTINHYSALCLAKTMWKLAIETVVSTSHIDEQWFRGGIIRGYFTIRVGAKHGLIPKPIALLESDVPESVSIEELVNWDRYETRE